MRVLVLRFSALGDIALLLPVLQKLKQTQPQLEITLATRSYLKTLCSPLPINFVGLDFNKRYRGFWGMLRLARHLKTQVQPDLVVDQHAVLRTHILRFAFWLMGLPSVALYKDRKGRKALKQYPQKILKPLDHSTEQYRRCFERAGFSLSFDRHHEHRVLYPSSAAVENLWHKHAGKLNLGIAPGAMHSSKIWPRAKMEKTLRLLQPHDTVLWLFGAPHEREALDALGKAVAKRYCVVSGKLSLGEEVALMQKLRAFVAMDSSNMHLAAMAGVPVISIWGGTHPYAGFAPLGQNEAHILQRDPQKLDCRPCSIFGTSHCFRGDFACMEGLGEAIVLKKIEAVLGENGAAPPR